jgi:hypothetical protein
MLDGGQLKIQVDTFKSIPQNDLRPGDGAAFGAGPQLPPHRRHLSRNRRQGSIRSFQSDTIGTAGQLDSPRTTDEPLPQTFPRWSDQKWKLDG